MHVTFDEVKDGLNQINHGVPLSESAELEWDDKWIWKDTRRDYGEERMIALCAIGERLYCVVYVDREDVRRIISLRKANYREVMDYASQN
jgi:uncharacterized DUF497 family protein